MFISNQDLQLELQPFDPPARTDPRADMAVRLPAAVQPFLTWLTAKPAPCESPKARKPGFYVTAALAATLGGCALSAFVMLSLSIHTVLAWILLPIGLLATSSGLGLFQVVIFHHCSHGAVFKTQKRNRLAGRLISAILLFKFFDSYRHEHMVHHNPAKLFTLEDEFTDFIVNICHFSSALTRGRLWRELVILLVSPVFHGQFMVKRIRGSLMSKNRLHNLLGITFWTLLILGSLAAHVFLVVEVAWVLPVTVLLQIATVFRILCEHRVPAIEIIKAGGPALVSHGTAAVFAGAPLPAKGLALERAAAAWTLWWLNMLTVQLFVRIFVLVGDAPCHDFHHRRPARKWTNYIHARQSDQDTGCCDYPVNYFETWGLFRAIDENFKALAAAPAGLIGKAGTAAA
jgi:fatty acid desaturase